MQMLIGYRTGTISSSIEALQSLHRRVNDDTMRNIVRIIMQQSLKTKSSITSVISYRNSTDL